MSRLNLSNDQIKKILKQLEDDIDNNIKNARVLEHRKEREQVLEHIIEEQQTEALLLKLRSEIEQAKSASARHEAADEEDDRKDEELLKSIDKSFEKLDELKKANDKIFEKIEDESLLTLIQDKRNENIVEKQDQLAQDKLIDLSIKNLTALGYTVSKQVNQQGQTIVNAINQNQGINITATYPPANQALNQPIINQTTVAGTTQPAPANQSNATNNGNTNTAVQPAPANLTNTALVYVKNAGNTEEDTINAAEHTFKEFIQPHNNLGVLLKLDKCIEPTKVELFNKSLVDQVETEKQHNIVQTSPTSWVIAHKSFDIKNVVDTIFARQSDILEEAITKATATQPPTLVQGIEEALRKSEAEEAYNDFMGSVRTPHYVR
ncbi:hypothetical protein L3V82_04540 [Thiotrichales bacterium 19S3-7]|nr:hypothetical protein [Thiotrichales bacterium 19S3-7]MCF6801364.1 hypothetical protein [Thiotrichales bacterium 19S3-11]